MVFKLHQRMIDTSANLDEMILETAASISLSSAAGELFWHALPCNFVGSSTRREISGSAGSKDKSEQEQLTGIR